MGSLPPRHRLRSDEEILDATCILLMTEMMADAYTEAQDFWDAQSAAASANGMHNSPELYGPSEIQRGIKSWLIQREFLPQPQNSVVDEPLIILETPSVPEPAVEAAVGKSDSRWRRSLRIKISFSRKRQHVHQDDSDENKLPYSPISPLKCWITKKRRWLVTSLTPTPHSVPTVNLRRRTRCVSDSALCVPRTNVESFQRPIRGTPVFRRSDESCNALISQLLSSARREKSRRMTMDDAQMAVAVSRRRELLPVNRSPPPALVFEDPALLPWPSRSIENSPTVDLDIRRSSPITGDEREEKTATATSRWYEALATLLICELLLVSVVVWCFVLVLLKVLRIRK